MIANLSESHASPAVEKEGIRSVLVVDDSKLQRRIIKGMLEKWGFEVRCADSAEAAIDLSLEAMPDLVLSDWMMPGLSGLELCSVLRGLPGDTWCYFILLTAKSDKTEIARGLDSGADDFLSKPVDRTELRARISAGDRIIRMQQRLARQRDLISDTAKQLSHVQDLIDKDLMQAKKIQESLVPRRDEHFGESRVSLLLQPCGHIGGDLVGMFAADARSIGFYSIDVSGHGITSAMMTARLAGYLSGEYFDQNVAISANPDGTRVLRPPQEVARDLNERLLVNSVVDEYFTMVYGTADLLTGRVQLVQAGHPHPMLLGADGSRTLVGDGGVPIGLLPGAHYDSFEVLMKPGDRLLLYTDGFTEAQGSDGEMIEEAGLLEMVGRIEGSGPGYLDALFAELLQVMDPRLGMEDDVSATMFEYQRPNPAAAGHRLEGGRRQKS